jgi:hypothetical protein
VLRRRSTGDPGGEQRVAVGLAGVGHGRYRAGI